MPVEVILPKVDMDMSHGILAVWHVGEGQLVQKGAALFDIETDKAAMEVEAPATGVLHNITAKPGDRVAVGSVIAWLYGEGEVVETVRPTLQTDTAHGVSTAPVDTTDVPKSDAHVANAQPTAAKAAERTPAPTATVTSFDVASALPSPQPGAVRATPAARKLAREVGLVLSDISGTGPLGRMQRCDAEQARDRQTLAPLTAPPHWTHQTGPLAITRRAGTGTPLVMLHGFTADSTSWAPLEKAMRHDRPLIRIDLPGHGKSPRRTLRNFADLARAVTEAFDEATRGAEQVHLLGHSLGGALALAIADIRPRRVASLSLIAPAGLGPEIDAATLTGIVRASRTESLWPWLRRLTALPDAVSESYANAAMKPRMDAALRACQASMADMLFPDGVQAFDLRPALQRVTAPTQILWGRQDHIMPHTQLLAVHGDFAMHLMSGAGHIPQIECPDRVADIVGRMIDAVQAPV